MTDLLKPMEGPQNRPKEEYKGPRQASKNPVSDTYPVFEKIKVEDKDGKSRHVLARVKTDRELRDGERYIVATEKTNSYMDTLFQMGQRTILRKGEPIPPLFREE